MALNLPLFDYQEETVEFALKNPYSIIALSMGLGKTATALAVKDRLINQRCLVICPSYLATTWKKEVGKFLKGQIVTCFRGSKEVFYPADTDFVIISYDLAIKNPILFEWATMVILDEGTAIKNMKAKRTEAIHKHIFENSIPRVHILTGTPIKNRIEEFYSLIALCNYNPNIADSPFLSKFTNSVDFADKFSHRREYTVNRGYKSFTVVQWEGVRNEDELKQWLKGIYISKRTNMPAVNYKTIFADSYDDEELRDAFDNYESGVSKVSPQVKAAAALRKTPMTIKYVDDLVDRGEIEGPVVIFTDHVESCKAMAAHWKVKPITGEMSPEERGQMALQFQAGKLDKAVATFGSFSEGVTLTRSNFMVLNDYCWVSGTIAQAIARINRLTQTRPCFVHMIFGSEQDEYIYGKVMEKAAVLDKVF